MGTRWQIAAVVTFYMAAALVMVFVNKAVLNSTPDLPLTFLFIQLSIAVVLIHLVSWFSEATGALAGKVVIPRISWPVAMNLTPVLTVGVVGLVFNTLCLRAVDASFFQIARGLVLPLTIAVSSLHSRNAPSRSVILAAGVVTAGFFIGVSPASYFSSYTSSTLETTALSLFYGFMSSLMIAVHAVLVKSAYDYVDNSSIKLAYWANLTSAAALLPFIFMTGEIGNLMKPRAEDEWRIFVVGSGVTGVFGFLLCMAGLLSIKVTSPVTHMFSSAARSVIQTVLGVFIFGDIITSNRGLSILVITIGTLYYTWLKSATPPPPQKTPPNERDIEKQQIKA